MADFCTVDFKTRTTDPKSILVTGGAGFIGSHVADFLMGPGIGSLSSMKSTIITIFELKKPI
jgi:FlaA1/EpsC-like NDP-sugar epimerase